MRYIFGFMVLLFLSAASCKKRDKPPVIITSQLKIHVEVLHHAVPIPNALVMVKSGTSVFPGYSPSMYDKVFQCNAQGRVTIDVLGAGEHVFGSIGYDPMEMDAVRGYRMMRVELLPGESKELNLQIPVSE